MKTVEQMMSQRVYERLSELLRGEEIAKEISDGEISLLDSRLSIDVSFVLPAEGTHRKAAVALGLLGAHHTTEDAQRFFKKRAPERHGVLGFDLWLGDSSRKVPWYRPFGPPAEDDPQLMEHVPQPPVASVAGAVPVMPAMGMPAMGMPAMGMPAMGMPAMPVMPAAPVMGPVAPFVVPLETMVWQMMQQWPQYTAMAAQASTTPQEYAARQLWTYITTTATQQSTTPERMLATQRWQQIAAQSMMPGMSPEQGQWMQQQQVQSIAMMAAQKGMSPEAFLSQQRWEQLVTMLQSPPATMMAGHVPFPFDGNKR
jgi:hypothetical protein